MINELKNDSLGIPTLDKCVKLLPFKIDTNFYYSPDRKLFLVGKEKVRNKHFLIPAPQSHELKKCIREHIVKLSGKVDVIFDEDMDCISATIFISEKDEVNKTNIIIPFSGNFANDYADFLIKLFDISL